jgi:hypothetical protein
MYYTFCRLQGALIFVNNRKLSLLKVKLRGKKVFKCNPPVLLNRQNFISAPAAKEFQ